MGIGCDSLYSEVYSDAHAPERRDVSGNCEYKTDLCMLHYLMSEVGYIWIDFMFTDMIWDESVMHDMQLLGCKKHSDAEVCC